MEDELEWLTCILEYVMGDNNHKSSNYKPLKLSLRVFLAVHTVAMVVYCVTKMITYSPMFERSFLIA